jgi:sec-independent protein translocase protein TatB
MFDIGWSELFVIGVIALIVVGPKELPKLLHQVGKYAAHARRMAPDFQRSMEDAAREADIGSMKEVRDAAKAMRDLRTMKLDDVAKPAPAARAPAPTVKPPAPTGPAAPASAAPAPAASVAPAPAASVAPAPAPASAPGDAGPA